MNYIKKFISSVHQELAPFGYKKSKKTGAEIARLEYLSKDRIQSVMNNCAKMLNEQDLLIEKTIKDEVNKLHGIIQSLNDQVKNTEWYQFKKRSDLRFKMQQTGAMAIGVTRALTLIKSLDPVS